MNKPLLRSNNINQTYLKWLVIILTLLCSHRVLAEDITNNQSTVSYGGLRSSIDDSHRAAIIEQNKTLLITDQIAGLASGKDRETIISEQTATTPPMILLSTIKVTKMPMKLSQPSGIAIRQVITMY